MSKENISELENCWVKKAMEVKKNLLSSEK